MLFMLIYCYPFIYVNLCSSMQAVYIFVELTRRCLLCEVLDADADNTCLLVRGVGSRSTLVEHSSEISCVVADEICYLSGCSHGFWFLMTVLVAGLNFGKMR